MKIVKSLFAFICLVTMISAIINAADFSTQDMIEFKTNDNQSVLVSRDNLLLKNLNQNQLSEGNTIRVPFTQKVVNDIFSYDFDNIQDVIVNIFLNQTATNVPFNYTYIPLALNKLFNLLNLPKPITPLVDIPTIDNAPALQFIAKILTRKLPNRPSLIGPYLATIKQKYSNDINAYQAVMQPIKQALYNTLHYLTDLDTQTIESLKLAQQMVTDNELGNYFYLGGGTLLMYMQSNLLAGNKEANAQHVQKFEQYLQGLLQMPAK